MIKNIFFDFNGTILNDVDLCYDILKKMMVHFDLNPIRKEEYLDHFFFPVDAYYHSLGFKKNEYKLQCSFFVDEYKNRWLKETNINNDLVDCFKILKEKGYKLYCLSATKIDMLENQLKILDLYKYFDGVIGSDNSSALGKIEYGKKYVINHNIDVTKSIMIGDTFHDYEVAKSIGFIPLLFSNGHNSYKLLSKTNQIIFNDYKELPNIINKL